MTRAGLVLVLVSSAVVACDGDASLESRACPCAAGYSCCEVTGLCIENGSTCELVVTPAQGKTNIRGKIAFGATVPVKWSVDEAEGGSIDGSGTYRAPLRPGEYRVRATTGAAATATATVTVGPIELTHLAGVRGGKGFADGVGGDARFGYLWGVTGDDENLYVADGFSIRRVSRATWEVETLAFGTASWFISAPLATAGTRLVAATSVPGPMSGSPWRLALVRIGPESGLVELLAGDPLDVGGGPKDGIGASARFTQIDAMIADADTLYVVDEQSLRKVDVESGEVTTLATWSAESALTTYSFSPRGSLALHDGGVYVISGGNTSNGGIGWRRHAIWRYDLATGAITDAALAPKFDATADAVPPSHFVKALCFSDALQQMVGIVGDCVATLDGEGPPKCIEQSPPVAGFAWMHCLPTPANGWAPQTELFTVSEASSALWRTRVRLGGKPAAPEVVAGLDANYGASPIPGTNMKLGAPTSVAADSTGVVAISAGTSIVVIDRMEFSVHENIHGQLALDGNGNVYVAGSPGVLSKLHFPSGLRTVLSDVSARGLAHDGDRSLYATRGEGVDRIDSVTGTATRLLDGEYFGPVAVDRGKSLFVAQRSAIGFPYNRLLRIDLGSGASTKLPTPAGGWEASALAFAPSGVLYVAEAEHQRVRALDVETGAVIGLVGKPGSVGVQLGLLPASLNEPASVALLQDGSLAIADHGENVVVVAR